MNIVDDVINECAQPYVNMIDLLLDINTDIWILPRERVFIDALNQKCKSIPNWFSSRVQSLKLERIAYERLSSLRNACSMHGTFNDGAVATSKQEVLLDRLIMLPDDNNRRDVKVIDTIDKERSEYCRSFNRCIGQSSDGWIPKDEPQFIELCTRLLLDEDD